MDRYDRQVRLWGQHGQNKLTSSQVCLINANATGTEILKNLCLAGVGSFTIIDSAIVNIEDVGNNFFLAHDHIGKNRGSAATEYLSELNDEVFGQSIEESVELLMSDDKDDFWKKFNCVITSGQLKLEIFNKLCSKCWHLNVPMVICKTLGFIGYLRLQFREHLVIDTHPDNIIPDFRLDRPFPELKSYLDSTQLNPLELGQYPYIVIIYKFLREWQTQQSFPEDRVPLNYQEKQQLKTLIKTAYEGFSGLENFQEAFKAVNTAVNASHISDELKSILNSSNTLNVGVSKFSLIIKAIKIFIEQNNGQLPVSGFLPDMASSSSRYIELQNIYRNKAKEDSDQIYNYVQEFSSNGGSPIAISLEEVSLFSKNIRHINLLESNEICDKPYWSANSINNSDTDEDENSFTSYYMCLRAVDHFYSVFGRYPGEQYDQVELDIGRLKENLRKNYCGSASPKVLDEKLYEICRYGGSELHTVASFIAGCGSQEVLKLITNQYVPINGILLYNSINSTTKIKILKQS